MPYRLAAFLENAIHFDQSANESFCQFTIIFVKHKPASFTLTKVSFDLCVQSKIYTQHLQSHRNKLES